MDAHVTISECASHHSLSISTVRCQIKASVVSARLVHGRYFIAEEGATQTFEQADK